MDERNKNLYLTYILIGFLYVIVKIIFVSVGYLHLGAIAHGALITIPVTLAGYLALKEKNNKNLWHKIIIFLPILALVLTPVYMYLNMGAEQWLTQGRLPVLIIYEIFSIIQIIISIFLLKNKNR
jgi:O-antigen/teichoic acid export membrane protein